MSERFSGEGPFERQYHAERDPDIETREHLKEIDRILAKLIETGPDLPSDVRQALRQQLQAHLAAIGLTSMDPPILASIHMRLQDRLRNIPTPPNYPLVEAFRENVQGLLNEALDANTQGRRAQSIMFSGSRRETTNTVPAIPVAEDIARYGQADWSSLSVRGGINLIDYLYTLGKIMSSEFVYTGVFEPHDNIRVDPNWRVDNGLYRAMTLRALGPDYVKRSGMNGWVMAHREA